MHATIFVIDKKMYGHYNEIIQRGKGESHGPDVRRPARYRYRRKEMTREGQAMGNWKIIT